MGRLPKHIGTRAEMLGSPRRPRGPFRVRVPGPSVGPSPEISAPGGAWPRPHRGPTRQVPAVPLPAWEASSSLPVPAQQHDPEEKQHEKDEELRPHHGQEAPLLDLPLLLDQGYPARLLPPDEPEVTRFVNLLTVLMEEDRR